MMTYDFLPEDLEKLDEQMRHIAARIRSCGQDMGESCRQSAETYHDNFPYEEAARQHALHCKRLSDLSRVRKLARVIPPPSGHATVRIGSLVTYRDLDRGDERTIRIGSYLCFNEEDVTIRKVSYSAPLASLLIDAEVGEVREGWIAGNERRFEVLEIEPDPGIEDRIPMED